LLRKKTQKECKLETSRRVLVLGCYAFIGANLCVFFCKIEAAGKSWLGGSIHVSTDEVDRSLGETGMFTEAPPLLCSSFSSWSGLNTVLPEDFSLHFFGESWPLS
jgi:hypothetical protein